MNAREMHSQALRLHQAGDLTSAETACREMLAVYPNDPNALNLLGIIAHQRGQLDHALEHLSRAASVAPAIAGIHANLGMVASSMGRWDYAASAYAQAAKLEPANPNHYRHLALNLAAMRKWDPAIAAYRRALRIRPTDPASWNDLGLALQCRGQLDAALAAFRQSLVLSPKVFTVHVNLGNVLQALGDLDAAIECYRNAIALKPDVGEAHTNLAHAFCNKDLVDDAVAACRKAIECRPTNPGFHANLAQALRLQGRMTDSIAAEEKALSLSPDNPAIASNRLFALQYSPDYSAQDLLAEHRKFNDRFAAPLAREIVPQNNDRNPDRRLRIGFVSPDFCDHCQSLFTVPLLSNLDREQFEIFLYSDTTRPDPITSRIRSLGHHGRPVCGVGDRELANAIRSDQIDILIDLTMHMANNRLLAFARKPAPVQISYLAYPGTTGLTAIDARLTDPHLDGPDADANYTEKSIRLPDTFWCYDASALDGPTPHDPGPLPALRNGHITFACLNNFSKVNEPTLRLWRQVLDAVPNSRLRLLAPLGSPRESVARILPAGRVDFVPRQNRRAYMTEFSRIDICLDTIPYNSHTTALDSLWMCVPLITRVGSTVVGRAGLSQLTNIGLPDLIAHADDQFVQIAKNLSSDTDRLLDLRKTLRDRVLASPLTNSPRFTRAFERACRSLWRSFASPASAPGTPGEDRGGGFAS